VKVMREAGFAARMRAGPWLSRRGVRRTGEWARRGHTDGAVQWITLVREIRPSGLMPFS